MTTTPDTAAALRLATMPDAIQAAIRRGDTATAASLTREMAPLEAEARAAQVADIRSRIADLEKRVVAAQKDLAVQAARCDEVLVAHRAAMEAVAPARAAVMAVASQIRDLESSLAEGRRALQRLAGVEW